MTVIFLDFDYCLNNVPYIKGTDDDVSSDDYTPQEVAEKQLDPTNVKNLNKILSVTGCNVVVSSSWRKFLSLKQMTEALDKAGMKKEFNKRFISKTPVTGIRHDEIQEWLDKWDGEKVTKFAIIDDDKSNFSKLNEFGDSFFHIKKSKGLSPKKADKIINFLTK
jgi:uncharacterized lipoprotein YehR (DUF1307 family)